MEYKKISELAKQIRGVSYKPDDLHEHLDEDSVILLRANNISNGKINLDDVVYVDKRKVASVQYLRRGDILVCASSGSKQLVGKAASFNLTQACTFGAFCKVVRPVSDIGDYLGAYFQSEIYRRQITDVAIGANINNIRNEHIDNMILPIRTRYENQAIVDTIMNIQKIIDNRSHELEMLDTLVKAGVCSADAYPILVKDGVCSKEYLAYTMRSKYFLDYILAFSNRTNLPKVNKNQVEGFKLPLPPIEVQEQFVRFVKCVDKSKAAVQKSLDETQVLFDSLMQKYFG